MSGYLTEDFGMMHVSTKFIVLWLLTEEQKENCFSVVSYVLDCAETNENFWNSIITGDETWVYSYNPD
jgi:hypothetical protein